MMKNAINAIAAAALGVVSMLSGPVAAQQQGMQPGPISGIQPGMQSSMSMAGFNVPLEPVRVNILDSFGYYQVTPNGNLVLYLVRGLPSTAAMQGILAMFGQGNPLRTLQSLVLGQVLTRMSVSIANLVGLAVQTAMASSL